MDKDLEKEYLEDLDHYDEGMGIHSTSYEKCKERLIRLAKIDNSNPSEALECLEDIYRNCVFISEISFTKQHTTYISPETNKSIDEQCNVIKPALLKAQEQEKVLEIIFEKNVDIIRIKHLIFKSQKNPKYWDLRYYNETRVIDDEKLTQEEFDLLKRYCNEQDN